LFATGVVDTGGNLPPTSLTAGANLPPVLSTLVEMVAKFTTPVANLPLVSLIPAAILLSVLLTPVACNLPPVSLIPVVHLEYLHEILKKFEMSLVLFSGTWGKMILEKI
jgi:hypothetical protein